MTRTVVKTLARVRTAVREIGRYTAHLMLNGRPGLLVSDYLAFRGYDQEFIERYGSAFGRVVASVYRERRGTDPRRAWKVHQTSGGTVKLIKPFLYETSDVDVFAQAERTYARTAAYAAAHPLPTPYTVVLDWADGDREAVTVHVTAPGPKAAVAAAIEQAQQVVDLFSPGEQAADALHEVATFIGHHKSAHETATFAGSDAPAAA